MNIQIIIWDLEDDPFGNVEHIAEHGVTIEEVEEVLLDASSSQSTSRSSGEAIMFGHTTAGRSLAVVFEHVDDNPLTVRPITAYDVED
jgi:uncharacterized DUF497 family protein